MKVNTILLEKFKAVDKLEMNFNGCTAIVTGGNNKGKTSVLRGMIDRIRFIRPELMVKIGEKEGRGELHLTDESRFVWEFDNEGKDKLVHITKDNIKTNVTVAFGKKFFPELFDIDKFLQSTPKEQTKQLQKILGVDFTDIERRYSEAYVERTARNLEAERFHVKLSKMLEVPEVNAVDLTELQAKKEAERNRLNNLYLMNVAHNKKLRDEFEASKIRIDEAVKKDNESTEVLREISKKLDEAVALLVKHGCAGTSVDLVACYAKTIPALIVASDLYPKVPEYIKELPSDEEIQRLDKVILEASEVNTAAKAYSDYISYRSETEAAKEDAKIADDKVKLIEEERQKMIAAAKFPEGITIGENGILVDGFPLDNNQLSSSKKYIAALRIGAIKMGEVKSLYFDASYLDKNSLAEIETWAASQQWEGEKGLQLLIERPDYDGGEIKYELIENAD